MSKLEPFLKNNYYSNPQYGYMDEEGNIVIEPQFFFAYHFDESGYARVYVKEDDDNISIIDQVGKIVTTPYVDVEDFKNGYAIVKKEDKEKSDDSEDKYKYGVVDTKYNEVVSCVFDSLTVDEILDAIRRNPEDADWIRSLARINFKNNNPKYPSKHTGVFYMAFPDINDYKYIIREKVNDKYDRMNDPIIVTYNSMRELFRDGWEAD